MGPEDLGAIAEALAQSQAREGEPLRAFFPAFGPRGRSQYPKHLEFFEAGQTKQERLFMAANRVGKTVAGAFEGTLHLLGEYPDWWPGRRFDHPTDAWACGTNAQTTRDIVQQVFLAPRGKGMIPQDRIIHTQAYRGVADAIETVWVRHVSCGTSKLVFKTYEQGRKSFEGLAKDWIWCDEEPPMDCYMEMLYRLLTTRGCIFTTFTPLQGRSEVVTSFLEADDEARESKCLIQAGWKDVPHLDEKSKETLIRATPPYLVQARTEGEPALGKGAIYPFDEALISVDPFPVPEFWPKAYGLDVGWERTAAIWGARDPGSGVIYLYSEYYQGGGPTSAPANHAVAIQSRGKWIPGAIDPVSAVHAITPFVSMGLDLTPADNKVERGIMEVFELFASGQLKVFRSLSDWFKEFRKYQRKESTGQPLKRDDHLMDATRYLITTGRNLMKPPPISEDGFKGMHRSPVAAYGNQGWMR